MSESPESNMLTVFDHDELLALARLDIEKGRIEPALLKIKQVLSNEQSNDNDQVATDQATTMAARIYAQLGLFDRAIDLFKAFLAKHPEALVESFQLGMAHFDIGEVDEALQIWEGLLKKQAVHPPALFYKGLVLAQKGNTLDAKQSLDILLKSAPPDNLYFGKAKELLQAIDSGKISSLSAKTQSQDAAEILVKDAYETGH